MNKKENDSSHECKMCSYRLKPVMYCNLLSVQLQSLEISNKKGDTLLIICNVFYQDNW